MSGPDGSNADVVILVNSVRRASGDPAGILRGLSSGIEGAAGAGVLLVGCVVVDGRRVSRTFFAAGAGWYCL